MKKHSSVFRLGAMALGTLFVVILLLELFPYSKLYIDKSAVNSRTIAFAVLGFSAVAGCLFLGIYVIKNRNAKRAEILTPMVGFFACLLAGALFFNYAGQGVLCSYTTKLEDISCRLPYKFFYGDGDYYEGKGTPVGYVCFWRGNCASEEITVSYDQQGFASELARIESQINDSCQYDGFICFTEESPNLPRLIQIRFNPSNGYVVYGRYSAPEEIPDFVPKPKQGQSVCK